jgi:hypothetical protein
MNNINPVVIVLVGLFFRIGVPFGITLLIMYGLRRLDARWQAEAELEHNTLVIDEEPCWKDQGLPTDQIKLRGTLSDQPCWQTHRLTNGRLREMCLSCEVFLDAPIPASHSHAHV